VNKLCIDVFFLFSRFNGNLGQVQVPIQPSHSQELDNNQQVNVDDDEQSDPGAVKDILSGHQHEFKQSLLTVKGQSKAHSDNYSDISDASEMGDAARGHISRSPSPLSKHSSLVQNSKPINGLYPTSLPYEVPKKSKSPPHNNDAFSKMDTVNKMDISETRNCDLQQTSDEVVPESLPGSPDEPASASAQLITSSGTLFDAEKDGGSHSIHSTPSTISPNGMPSPHSYTYHASTSECANLNTLVEVAASMSKHATSDSENSRKKASSKGGNSLLNSVTAMPSQGIMCSNHVREDDSSDQQSSQEQVCVLSCGISGQPMVTEGTMQEDSKSDKVAMYNEETVVKAENGIATLQYAPVGSDPCSHDDGHNSDSSGSGSIVSTHKKRFKKISNKQADRQLKKSIKASNNNAEEPKGTRAPETPALQPIGPIFNVNLTPISPGADHVSSDHIPPENNPSALKQPMLSVKHDQGKVSRVHSKSPVPANELSTATSSSSGRINNQMSTNKPDQTSLFDTPSSVKHEGSETQMTELKYASQQNRKSRKRKNLEGTGAIKKPANPYTKEFIVQNEVDSGKHKPHYIPSFATDTTTAVATAERISAAHSPEHLTAAAAAAAAAKYPGFHYDEKMPMPFNMQLQSFQNQQKHQMKLQEEEYTKLQLQQQQQQQQQQWKNEDQEKILKQHISQQQSKMKLPKKPLEATNSSSPTDSISRARSPVVSATSGAVSQVTPSLQVPVTHTAITSYPQMMSQNALSPASKSHDTNRMTPDHTRSSLPHDLNQKQLTDSPKGGIKGKPTNKPRHSKYRNNNNATHGRSTRSPELSSQQQLSGKPAIGGTHVQQPSGWPHSFNQGISQHTNVISGSGVQQQSTSHAHQQQLQQQQHAIVSQQLSQQQQHQKQSHTIANLTRSVTTTVASVQQPHAAALWSSAAHVVPDHKPGEEHNQHKAVATAVMSESRETPQKVTSNPVAQVKRSHSGGGSGEQPATATAIQMASSSGQQQQQQQQQQSPSAHPQNVLQVFQQQQPPNQTVLQAYLAQMQQQQHQQQQQQQQQEQNKLNQQLQAAAAAAQQNAAAVAAAQQQNAQILNPIMRNTLIPLLPSSEEWIKQVLNYFTVIVNIMLCSCFFFILVDINATAEFGVATEWFTCRWSACCHTGTDCNVATTAAAAATANGPANATSSHASPTTSGVPTTTSTTAATTATVTTDSDRKSLCCHCSGCWSNTHALHFSILPPSVSARMHISMESIVTLLHWQCYYFIHHL